MVSGLNPLQHSLLPWSMRGSPEPKCTYQPPTTTLTMCREPSLGWAASPRQLHAWSENALRAAQHRTAYADWSSSLLRAGEAFGASACCAVSFVPATSLAARTDFATDGLPSPAPSGVVQQIHLLQDCMHTCRDAPFREHESDQPRLHQGMVACIRMHML